VSFIFSIPIFNYRVGDQSVTKFNSLASEPSYYGKIITVLMLSFITTREILMNRKYNLLSDWKSDKSIWFLFTFQIISSGSSFALLLYLLVIAKYLNNHFTLKQIILSTFIILIGLTILIQIQSTTFTRITNLGEAIFTFNTEKIFEADGSGAFRVAPTILYIQEFSFFNMNNWIGYGNDFTRFHLANISAAINPEEGLDIGLFPGFIWDYGIIGLILLLSFVFKSAISDKFDFLIWLIIALDAPFNTQLFWITLICMSTNKYLLKKYSHGISNSSANQNINNHSNIQCKCIP
jgi:hypothetical protein